ncbi:MAG: hypothetical protein KC635_09645, partial [Myxococcales bacterium]|nr:hypothetical protein [Myxococcales bacterium]
HGALIERLGTFRTRHVGHARSTIAAVTAVTLYPNIAGEVRMAEVRIGLRLKSDRREPLVTVRVDASDVLETEAAIDRLAERLGVPVEREDRAVSPNHFAV